jgi:Protein kinase domain
MPANLPFVFCNYKSILGTVTRSDAWHKLENTGYVKEGSIVFGQNSPDANDLSIAFAEIDRSRWQGEIDMYPDIIKAIEKLYSSQPSANVVNTSGFREFPADVSIGEYQDARVPYGLWYFIEFKLPKGNLISADNCGQMLDYFDMAHERQPHRSTFTAILSDFDAAFVFDADYRGGFVTISRNAAPSLADAIVYVDQLSRKQFQPVPAMHKDLSSNYSFIDNSKHHVLLSVPFPNSSSTRTRTKSKRVSENSIWRDPRRFPQGRKEFVLKMARGDRNIANEVKILKALQKLQCKHLPELVWSPKLSKELGIVPVGLPIDFRQPVKMFRRIVEGMVDGLQFLHSNRIIHRDIRPSNLIVHGMDAIIIDFEASVLTDSDKTAMTYEGGYICWPRRLLESNTEHYIPQPADDLFACILVVLHLLFPYRFDTFRMSGISIGTPRPPETTQLLELWNEIDKSQIWGPFVTAAGSLEYDKLKGMADVFCSI